MRVLVVEDADDLRESFVSLLEFVGCEVRSASCGYTALAEVADFTPELVLTDYMMPRMDGLELIRRLKGEANLRHVPMVLVTANTSPDTESVARAFGASDVVFKPADVIAVLERCRRGEYRVD